MTIVWNLIKAFLVGGALCMIGEILLLKTKLTPARILTQNALAISADISYSFHWFV